jgi:hypothetical protein
MARVKKAPQFRNQVRFRTVVPRGIQRKSRTFTSQRPLTWQEIPRHPKKVLEANADTSTKPLAIGAPEQKTPWPQFPLRKELILSTNTARQTQPSSLPKRSPPSRTPRPLASPLPQTSHAKLPLISPSPQPSPAKAPQVSDQVPFKPVVRRSYQTNLTVFADRRREARANSSGNGDFGTNSVVMSRIIVASPPPSPTMSSPRKSLLNQFLEACVSPPSPFTSTVVLPEVFSLQGVKRSFQTLFEDSVDSPCIYEERICKIRRISTGLQGYTVNKRMSRRRYYQKQGKSYAFVLKTRLKKKERFEKRLFAALKNIASGQLTGHSTLPNTVHECRPLIVAPVEVNIPSPQDHDVAMMDYMMTGPLVELKPAPTTVQSVVASRACIASSPSQLNEDICSITSTLRQMTLGSHEEAAVINLLSKRSSMPQTLPPRICTGQSTKSRIPTPPTSHGEDLPTEIVAKDVLVVNSRIITPPAVDLNYTAPFSHKTPEKVSRAANGTAPNTTQKVLETTEDSVKETTPRLREGPSSMPLKKRQVMPLNKPTPVSFLFRVVKVV